MNNPENDSKNNSPDDSGESQPDFPMSMFCFYPGNPCIDPAAIIIPQHCVIARLSMFERRPLTYLCRLICKDSAKDEGATKGQHFDAPHLMAKVWIDVHLTHRWSSPGIKCLGMDEAKGLSNTHEPSAWEISSSDCFVRSHE